jgi:hypothetical protein
MQQISQSYSLLQDKEAMSEAVANVRWLIAEGLHKLQTDLPATPQHPTSPPTTTRLPGRIHHPVAVLGHEGMGTPAMRFVTGMSGVGVLASEAGRGVGAAVRLRRWGSS